MSVLTRIMLGKTQAAHANLGDAYAWHQALWQAFPDLDGERRDFLFRIDDAGQDLRVLLLSERIPQPPNRSSGAWGS